MHQVRPHQAHCGSGPGGVRGPRRPRGLRAREEELHVPQTDLPPGRVRD